MFNRLRSADVPRAGVVIASGGNAGIAAATAARALGVTMRGLPARGVECGQARSGWPSLGARVVVGGPAYADALAACLARQRENRRAADACLRPARGGGRCRHAGRRRSRTTAGLPDRMLVSVGGGGLVAGIAAWCAGRCRVDALEPELAPTLHAALAAGAPVDVQVGGIAADSLGAKRIGELAWPICRQHVAAAHLLDDGAIAAAQQRMWQRAAAGGGAGRRAAAGGIVERRREARTARARTGGGLRRQLRPGGDARALKTPRASGAPACRCLGLRPARPPSRAPSPTPPKAWTGRCRRPSPGRACRRPCRQPASRRS